MKEDWHVKERPNDAHQFSEIEFPGYQDVEFLKDPTICVHPEPPSLFLYETPFLVVGYH
jgi:hypothetical protein